MFEHQQHLKLFLQEVSLEHGDIEHHTGLRRLSLSTSLKAALKLRGETAVFIPNNGKPLGFMNLLCCVTTSRPTESEAAGAQNKS